MTGWITRHVQALLFAAGRLARAPFSTAFTVLVIAIALTLPAAFGLFIDSMRNATGELASAVDMTVYFKSGTPLEQARQLAGRAREREGIANVEVISADDALKSFREQSGFGAALDALNENPLPHALVIRPKPDATSTAQIDALHRYLIAWPEVELVQVDTQWVQRLEAILDLLRRLILGTAALLGIGVLAIVGNTIRLEIWNRRAEIEVTKLVGGSNAYVRRPFLYTGLLYGLLGAGLAALLVWTALALLANPVGRLAASYGSAFALQTPSLREVGILLAIGAGLGLLGAWTAAARHLSRITPRA
ncbi:MAG: permease-like cell division protein FtsX [Nevskiaceae bacterium]|jgi:cell division transport system permease protein|nr:permease-like cell division protein FtsX [Nevskiaceae bacterium]